MSGSLLLAINHDISCCKRGAVFEKCVGQAVAEKSRVDERPAEGEDGGSQSYRYDGSTE